MIVMDNKEEAATIQRTSLEEPGMWEVILLNDNFTPQDFVVLVLQQIFHHSEHRAYEIMMNIHKAGEGIAGIYIKDVAGTKADHVLKFAQANGFPLATKLRKV